MKNSLFLKNANPDQILQKLTQDERKLIIALIRRDPFAPVYGLATVGYTIVLCIVLLWPFDISQAITHAQAWPLLDLPYGFWSFHPLFLRDTISNIVYFIPYGFVLAGLFQRHTGRTGLREWVVITGISFLLSGCVEVLQHWSPVRHSSVMDIATNVLGTVAGLVAYKQYLLLLKIQNIRRD